MANLSMVSDIPMSVEEVSGSSAPALANSSALRFPRILLRPGIQIRMEILERYTLSMLVAIISGEEGEETDFFQFSSGISEKEKTAWKKLSRS